MDAYSTFDYPSAHSSEVEMDVPIAADLSTFVSDFRTHSRRPASCAACGPQ